MKKRFLIALSVLLVFGLVAVAVAYNRVNTPKQESATSCPMNRQSTADATGKHEGSRCGMADCCKDGKCSMGGACCKDKDACPMKQKGESAATTDDASKTTVTSSDGSGETCCQKGAACCQGGGACCKPKS